MLAPFGKRAQPLGVRFLLLLVALSLSSCAVRVPSTSPKAPTSSFFTASDGKELSLRHWNLRARPATVIIALHGIEGAGRDFKNLGKALPSQAPGTTLYALNLRGGGYDPTAKERGNIASPQLWQQDLRELHGALRQRHPHARFLWLGESMGSLIALHTAAATSSPPEGLVLASPVVSLDVIPAWQFRALKTAAFVAPSARVSLESLAGGSFRATTSSDHFDQSAGNPYHVGRYTLRYLKTLATLAQEMPNKALETKVPILMLAGQKDFLIQPQQLRRFAERFPTTPQVRFFKDSHHLLFYDKEKAEVISSVLTWNPERHSQKAIDRRPSIKPGGLRETLARPE